MSRHLRRIKHTTTRRDRRRSLERVNRELWKIIWVLARREPEGLTITDKEMLRVPHVPEVWITTDYAAQARTITAIGGGK